MPELPEVETMCRGIAGVAGSRIEQAEVIRCRRKPIAIEPRGAAFARRLRGRLIDRVSRIGKRVVLWLDSGEAVVFEPRMTGLVLLADPPSREHLRLRLRLSGACPALHYWDRRGLGSVRLLSAEQFRERFDAPNLGRDALEITAEQLRERLAGSRRAVKVALLDQRALAGIGNLYAAEILHVARLHPERRCDALRPQNWAALHSAIGEVLQAAIRYEGSTLGDGTYRNALNQQGRYQNHHRVYGKEGQACPSCTRGTVVRIVQAQRSTFYCPRCQRKR